MKPLHDHDDSAPLPQGMADPGLDPELCQRPGAPAPETAW